MIFTGELLGIDYLFSQSGKALVPDHEVEEEEELNDSTPIDEGFEELEEDDPTAQLVEVFLPSRNAQKPLSSCSSTPTNARPVSSTAEAIVPTTAVQQSLTAPTNIETAAATQQPPASPSVSTFL